MDALYWAIFFQTKPFMTQFLVLTKIIITITTLDIDNTSEIA